jgi:hypothetical protein
MVVETMAEQEFPSTGSGPELVEGCSECNQRRACQDLYRKLGSDKGPSIVRKVLAAFVLPIIVFIAALAISDKALATVIESVHTRTAAGLAIAALAVFACILITKLLRHKQL